MEAKIKGKGKEVKREIKEEDEAMEPTSKGKDKGTDIEREVKEESDMMDTDRKGKGKATKGEVKEKDKLENPGFDYQDIGFNDREITMDSEAETFAAMAELNAEDEESAAALRRLEAFERSSFDDDEYMFFCGHRPVDTRTWKEKVVEAVNIPTINKTLARSTYKVSEAELL